LRRPTADQKRWLERNFAQVMGDLAKPDIKVLGLDDPAAPIVLESETHYPASSSLIGSSSFAEPDHWVRAFGRDFRTENRNHPYHLSGLAVKSVVRYEVCDQLKVGFLGAFLDLRSAFGTLTRKYENKEGGVEVTTMLRLNRGVVPTARLAEFNQFVDAVLGQGRIWFGLKPAPGAQ
jgi:hypothetical protein